MPDNITRYLYLFETMGGQAAEDQLRSLAEATQQSAKKSIESLTQLRDAWKMVSDEVRASAEGLADSQQRIMTSTVFRDVPMGTTPASGELPPGFDQYLRQRTTTVETIKEEGTVVKTTTENFNEYGVVISKVIREQGLLADGTRSTVAVYETLAASVERATRVMQYSEVYRGVPMGTTPQGGLPDSQYLRQTRTTIETPLDDQRKLIETTTLSLNDQGVAISKVIQSQIMLGQQVMSTSTTYEQLAVSVDHASRTMQTSATYRGVPIGATGASGLPPDAGQYLRQTQETTEAVENGLKTTQRITTAYNDKAEVMGRVIATERELANGVKETTYSMEGAEKAVGAFNSRFARHLTWIAQGMLIWGSLRLVKQVIGEWVDVQRELDQELGYFQVAMGSSQAAMDEYVDTVMELSRAYALMPEQVAPAVTTAYRAGEQDMAPYAAAFTRLTGVDMATSMRELIALHKQFPDRSMIDLLDAWTTAWATSTMTMGEFTTMFESAGGLAVQFNTNFETVAQLMGHISKVTGESGASVERFTRVLTDFYKEGNKTREITEQLIGATVRYTETGEEVRRPIENIIQAISELDTAQKQMIANTIRSQLGQQWAQWFMVIVDGFEVAQTEMGSFNKGVETMSERFNAGVEGMTAAWGRLLLAIGNLGPINDAIERITDLLDLFGRRAGEGGLGLARGILEQIAKIPTISGPLGWGLLGRSLGTMLGEALAPPPIAPPTGPGAQDWWQRAGIGGQQAAAPFAAAPYTAAPTGRFELPSTAGVDVAELQTMIDLMAGAHDSQLNAFGFFEDAIVETYIAVDEYGNLVGTLLIPSTVDAAQALQMLASLPRQFFQGGVAEWEMTKLLYGVYEERYRQYEVPMGQEMDVVGPTGEVETFWTGPRADAERAATTQLGNLAEGARELTRWQDRQTEAYKRGVAAWETTITGLPGVSGPTPVTAYDMALTGVGLYQDKWDEPVRQMRQNVEDINAGRPPEYGDIWSKPWVQDIFAPIMGQGPEAMKGGLAMYEGGYYGLTQPWEAYEPQLPTLEREMEAWIAGREQKQVNLGKIEEYLISKGYGPGDVGGFVEAVDMPPGLKAIIGDLTPEEYIDKVKSLGLETGGALTTSLTEELSKTPWIFKVISSWQTGVEEQSALFDTLGFTMGSTAQEGFMRGMTDDMIGALVQAVLDALSDEGYE